jgi:hypothetical protein
MTARTTTRLISETQKALDVKEGVHLRSEIGFS